MANPSSSTLAYAELAPHSLQIAVVSGRRVVALRGFSLDAKADIAAFVAEHGISGLSRAGLLPAKGHLHRAADAEAGAVRQPAALLAHAAKLSPHYESTAVAVAVDAATGLAPDATRATPWLLASADGAAHAAASSLLGDLGLAPAELTLSAPAHIGALAASLGDGETGLVVFLGDEQSHLAWVNDAGVSEVVASPFNFPALYEAVQHGLGLKFKAAAAKLFYNENYDFADAAPKIAEPFAAGLRPLLAGRPVSRLHVAGLTPAHTWLVAQTASALGVAPWTPDGAAFGAGLDVKAVDAGAVFAGVLRLAATGSADTAWVQAPLDVLVSRAPARPRTATPFAKPAPAVAPEETAPAPAPKPAAAPVSKPAAPKPAPAAPAPKAPAAKPVAPAPAAKAPPAKPAPVAPAKPAAKAPPPAPKPAPVEAEADAVEQVDLSLPNDMFEGMGEEEAVAKPVAKRSPAARPAAPAARKSGNKGPIFIAGGVALVAAVVGLAFHFRSPANRPEPKPAPEAPATAAPAAPAPAPAPAPAQAPGTLAPVANVPPPAPISVPTAAPAASPTSDQFAGNPRRFGNSRYRLEVADKGYIKAITTTRDDVLIESAASISLQGSYVGSTGRRQWFPVGGVEDAGYQATVQKSVRDGFTVFDIKVTHPRFELTQTFTCIEDAVRVSARFKPINLQDPRGAIVGVHALRFSPFAMNTTQRMRETPGYFNYSVRNGSMKIGFDTNFWARDGANGLQTIVAGENGVAFHFTDSTEPSVNSLNFEIVVP